MSTHYTIPQDANTVHAGTTVPMDWVSGMIMDDFYDRSGNNTDLSPQQLLQIMHMTSTPAGSDLIVRDIVRGLGFTGLSEEFLAQMAQQIAEDAANSIEEVEELTRL